VGAGTTTAQDGALVPLLPPLRVLVVSPKGVVGGAESWLLTLLDATRRLAVTALVLEDGDLTAALRDRGIPVSVQHVGRRPVDALAAAPGVARALRSSDPDVVLASGVKAQLVVGPVAAATGVPCVWVKHDHSYDRQLGLVLGRLATAVVATAEDVGRATGREDVVVVHPPAPPAPLAPEEARRRWVELGLVDDGAPVLAMATRLIPYKGVDTAIRALAEAGGRGWRLLVAGDADPATPAEGERLASLAHDLGVQDRVHLTGAVPSVSRLLAGVDAVAVLTRPDGPRSPGREGFSMAGFEAMAAGVPVIAVDDGGPGARRVGHDAGALVPPDDARALAAVLGELADPGLRRSMGEVGRARTQGHPGAQECADQLATALARAARKPGAGLVDGPPVSVVTTVLDEGRAITALLDRLLPQLRADDEVVVVDGGSTDDTADRVSSLASHDPRVRLVVRPGAGISEGRNTGVRAARHDVIACTDGGCEPAPEWLAALRAGAAERGAGQLMTGVYRATSAPGRPDQEAMAVVGYPDPAEARRPTPLVRAYGALLGRVYDASLPTGRSMAFRREAWAAAGGFPEHLRTGEDVLFGRAITRTGRRADLCVDALVTWQQRGDLRSTLRMYRSYGHGGGRSGSPLLVGRDLARALAYVVGPLLVWRAPSSRGLVAGGLAAYLSLPLLRALRREDPALVVALVPVAAALRDCAKAWGCLQGLRDARASRRSRR